MALTERQQEIKDLLTQGKNAEQIGNALGITTNAVYQQIRRMRAGGANVSTPTGGGAAKKAGRKSAAKGRKAPRLESPPKPAPTPAVARPTTPLQAVRARRDEINAACREVQAEVATAERALATAKANAEKIVARHKDELKALDRAEAALRPQQATAPAPKAAPKKPARKRPSRAKAPAPAPAVSSNGSQAASAPQDAPQAPVPAPEAPAAA